MKGIGNLLKKNRDWVIVLLLGLMPIIADLFLEGLLFWNTTLGCLNMMAHISTLYTSLFLAYIFQFEIDKLAYPYEDTLLYVLNFIVLFIGYYLLKKLYLKFPKYRKLMVLAGIILLIFAIGWPLNFCLTFSFG